MKSKNLLDRSQAATVLEVAKVAGVSPSTVSRILNGTAAVSSSKRQAVEAAIAKLDFRPNLLARGLRKGRGMTIGILAQYVDSPFFTASLIGIERGLEGSGFAPIIVSGHWNAKEEAERIALLISRRIDGVIILTGSLSDERILSFSRSVPIVATGRSLPPGNVFSIAVDNVYGGYIATKHLIELGHRRIAFLGGMDNHLDAADRLKGYRKALREAGISFDKNLVTKANFRSSGGLAAVTRLVESRQEFSAVFAANDESALGARLGLFRKGLRVPEDVSLVGFDDLPIALYSTPPLTTVRQSLLEIGKRAAESLLDLLNGRKPSSDGMPGLELIVRETTRQYSKRS